MNSIQIQQKNQKLHYQLKVAQIKQQYELVFHIKEQINILREYSKLKGLWCSGIPVY